MGLRSRQRIKHATTISRRRRGAVARTGARSWQRGRFTLHQVIGSQPGGRGIRRSQTATSSHRGRGVRALATPGHTEGGTASADGCVVPAMYCLGRVRPHRFPWRPTDQMWQACNAWPACRRRPALPGQYGSPDVVDRSRVRENRYRACATRGFQRLAPAEGRHPTDAEAIRRRYAARRCPRRAADYCAANWQPMSRLIPKGPHGNGRHFDSQRGTGRKRNEVPRCDTAAGTDGRTWRGSTPARVANSRMGDSFTGCFASTPSA